ncbi:MAG: rhomboid family intramembrane serine protease [Ferruginibacter sp.]|nr:rhomboid family intramembrane serine protease [Ferruginibacter sp.]
MTEVGITTLIIILANVFCSLQGLNDPLIFKRYNFEIDKILLQKDYKRLVISGFFHVSWVHLILNMASLCFFSGGLELHLGGVKYLVIYFASLLGGNLFSLFIHRNHGDYNALGASGAVTGIIFATIALYPGFAIGFFGIHLPIPGWFYGFLYVLFSIYGIKSKDNNIGHDGHLAGGVTGIVMAVLLEPAALANNYLAILAITIPSLFFIFIIVTKPRFLLIENRYFKDHKKNYNIEHIHLTENLDHQQEIDLILEKIHQNGIASLSNLEKEKLDYYSKILR